MIACEQGFLAAWFSFMELKSCELEAADTFSFDLHHSLPCNLNQVAVSESSFPIWTQDRQSDLPSKMVVRIVDMR